MASHRVLLGVGIVALLVMASICGYVIFTRPSNQRVETEKIKDVIKTTAEGTIIKYQETSFYSSEDFSAVLEHQENFKSQLIQEFKEWIIGVTAENCVVDFNQSSEAVILQCDINGASYGTNSYDMHFLLGNWPFDLYQFEEYEKKLVYEGTVNEIPTTIAFNFPYPLEHCHEHVWPKQ